MDLSILPLDAIDAATLDSLTAGAVSEGKLIEFKSALPGRADGEKIEFLADVSSFANASGGHIFYGIVEQGGIAIDVPGLPGIDADAEIRRLESMLQDGLDPRIPGVACRAVRATNGSCVVVLRIPNSWVAPHMIVFKQNSRFYSRNSAGKYALDVAELRGAFALSASVGERIREFRDFRLGKIIVGETPVPLAPRAALTLHFAPLSAFARDGRRDLISEGATADGLQMFEGGFYNNWFNFDGIVTSGAPSQSGGVNGYAQLYRDGRVEIVSVFDEEAQARKMLRSTYLEQNAIERTEGTLKYLESNGVEPPIAVYVSFIGVRGFQIPPRGFQLAQIGVDRDVLSIPGVLYTGAPQKTPGLLRPCFDVLWNACGHKASPNFDNNGGWRMSRF